MSYQEITAQMMASDAPLSTTLLNLLNSNTKAMSQGVLMHTGIAGLPGQAGRWYAIVGAFSVVETYSIRVPAFAASVKVKVYCKCATAPGEARVKINGVTANNDRTIGEEFTWEDFTVDDPGSGWMYLEILGKSGGATITIRDVIAYMDAL